MVLLPPQGFYAEVATPLLTNVMMIYEGGANLTETNFSQYYNGSEIVVAGQITDNNIETFSPRVVAISVRAPTVWVIFCLFGLHIKETWWFLLYWYTPFIKMCSICHPGKQTCGIFWNKFQYCNDRIYVREQHQKALGLPDSKAAPR